MWNTVLILIDEYIEQTLIQYIAITINNATELLAHSVALKFANKHHFNGHT